METRVKRLKIYSDDFKRKVVSEAKLGISLSSLSLKYGIGGNMTISRWCKAYGVVLSEYEYIDVPLPIGSITKPIEEMGKSKKSMTEKSVQKPLADQVKLLEYELALYKKLVEIAKRDYDLDLVKKLNTKPSEK